MAAEMEIWNSLEVAKLAVGILTPISVVLIGLWINSRLKLLDHSQWVNQKIIERRLVLFDEIAPDINDLVCYFTYIGCWKDYTPNKIVSLKRKLDRLAHINSPLFSGEFLNIYNSFMHSCYETYTGWGNDAKLRTKFIKRKDAADASWKTEWEDIFTTNKVLEWSEIQKKYTCLMEFFSSELGLELNGNAFISGRIPKR